MRTAALLPSALPSLGLALSFSVALSLGLPAVATAQTATEVIVKLDERANLAKTQFFEYEVINEEKGRESGVMRLQVSLSGEERFTEFLAPGDMKGTRVLVKNRAQMYVYLPAYNKVRRIASHTTSGGFMGTTYSNDDMATSFYGPVYAFSMVSEDDKEWVVEGPPNEGVKVAYGKIEITISKANNLPTKIRYFNKDEVHVKTEIRSGYSCSGEVCNAESMKMTDHTRNDASTELLRRDWKVNPELPSSLFSLRNLQP
jgi:outer membrane lipoprotein-sorting protein